MTFEAFRATHFSLLTALFNQRSHVGPKRNLCILFSLLASTMIDITLSYPLPICTILPYITVRVVKANFCIDLQQPSLFHFLCGGILGVSIVDMVVCWVWAIQHTEDTKDVPSGNRGWHRPVALEYARPWNMQQPGSSTSWPHFMQCRSLDSIY